MANGIVRIIMEAAGLGRVRAAFRGVVDEARRADRAVATSAESGARRRMLTAEQLDRDMRAKARSRASAETAADRVIDQSRERLSRADRARRREEERRMRSALRARSRLSSLSTVGAVVSGVGGAALDRVGSWGSAIGIPSRDEMISRYITNEQRLIRMASAGHVDPGALSARVNEVARSTNTDPGAIVEALDVAQNRFSRLQDFADNMEAIARAANAAGGAEALPEWVAALGEFQRQLGTSAEDVPALLGSMVEMMDQGSISAEDVASNFAEVMGVFASLRGEGARGLAGSTEFLALAETLGAGGVAAPEAATRARAMITSLGDARVRSRMERVIGRDAFDANGTMNISFGELARRMGEHADVFGNSRGLTRVFGNGDVRARAGWVSLMNTEMARNATPDSSTRARTIDELMATSAESGNERIDRTMGALMDSTSGRAISARIQTETTFAERGDELVALMTEHGGALAQLTAEYPVAAEALSTVSQVAGSLAGTLATLNMAMGGGLFGGAAGAAGAAGGAAGAGAGGGLLGSLVGAVPALGALFTTGDTTGGASTSEADRYSAIMRNMTEGAREAYRSSLHDSTTAEGRAYNAELGRALVERGSTSSGMIIGLSAASIRELAASVGRETGRAVAAGAPADGREPGEPGRR